MLSSLTGGFGGGELNTSPSGTSDALLFVDSFNSEAKGSNGAVLGFGCDSIEGEESKGSIWEGGGGGGGGTSISCSLGETEGDGSSSNGLKEGGGGGEKEDSALGDFFSASP